LYNSAHVSINGVVGTFHGRRKIDTTFWQDGPDEQLKRGTVQRIATPTSTKGSSPYHIGHDATQILKGRRRRRGR
jgi:hypothetical protein